MDKAFIKNPVEAYEKQKEENYQLKAENIKFTLDSKKLIAQYSAKLERLRQTLIEIKEIAGRIKETCEEDVGSYSCACDYKEQILKKISEVIDD